MNADDTRPLPAGRVAHLNASARAAEYLRHGRHARPTRAAAATKWCRQRWRTAAVSLGLAAWIATATALLFQQPSEARWPVPPAADPADTAPPAAGGAPPGEHGPWHWPSRFRPLADSAAGRPDTSAPRRSTVPPPAAGHAAPSPKQPATGQPAPVRPLMPPEQPDATASPRPKPRITIVIPLLGGRR